ncbi:MAG: SRPBCC family protein [Planctomycetes bacterium]|nr:SRPBCC family protein [Planctomycetota bacterium]
MSNTKFVLRTMVLALAGSVLVFLGVGLVLADEWTVSTTRRMPVPAERVAAQVVDLDAWAKWSSIDFQLGNGTELEVTGEAGEPGQEAAWTGPLGRAVIALDGVTADGVDYRIGYAYQHGNVGGKFSGRISWRATDDGCEVTWTESGKLGSLIERWTNWFGALQDKVQQIQRASLAGLEERVIEAGEASDPAAGK